MEETLKSLPADLNETYRRMIASIPKDLKADAIRLLQFLVHSKRPFKLAEAREVIATQIENEPRGFDIKRRLFCETDVMDYCPGLAIVVHATDEGLHLAHFSVKEYLLEQNDLRNTTANISNTMKCLAYLTDIRNSHGLIASNFSMARYAGSFLTEWGSNSSFARYAAKIWTYHAALAQASEDVFRVTVRLLQRSNIPAMGSFVVSV